MQLFEHAVAQFRRVMAMRVKRQRWDVHVNSLGRYSLSSAWLRSDRRFPREEGAERYVLKALVEVDLMNPDRMGAPPEQNALGAFLLCGRTNAHPQDNLAGIRVEHHFAPPRDPAAGQGGEAANDKGAGKPGRQLLLPSPVGRGSNDHPDHAADRRDQRERERRKADEVVALDGAMPRDPRYIAQFLARHPDP